MSYFDNVIDLSKGSVSEYGLNVLSFEVGPTMVGGRFMQPSSRMFPVALTKKNAPREISLELEFIGIDTEDVTTKIAEFTKRIQDGVDILAHDGYGYFCVAEKIKAPEEEAPWIYVMDLELVGVRHKNKATVDVTDGSSFYVGGMIETEAVLTITPTANPTEATVKITDEDGNVTTDVSISNITDVVIVDGLTTKIIQAGVNKFNDATLFEFPKLSVGKNTVEITGSVVVSVSYYPLYL